MEWTWDDDDVPSDMKQLPMTSNANGGSLRAWRFNHRPLVRSLSGLIRLETVAVAIVHRTRQMIAEMRRPHEKPILTNKY